MGNDDTNCRIISMAILRRSNMENLRGKYVVVVFDDNAHYICTIPGYMTRQQAVKYCKENTNEDDEYLYMTATEHRSDKFYKARRP